MLDSDLLIDMLLEAPNPPVNKVVSKKPETNKQFSEKFIPLAESILQVVFNNTCKHTDRKICDLIIQDYNETKIGIRIRRSKYIIDYGKQFTLSSTSSRKKESELVQILKHKKINYMFHAFEHIDSNDKNLKLSNWSILNMDVVPYNTLMKFNPEIKGGPDNNTFFGIDILPIWKKYPTFIVARDPNFKF